MKAFEEVNRLRGKMLAGDLDPEEPVFTLRARDVLAGDVVDYWCNLATGAGVPVEKVVEARNLAAAMRIWPIQQIPGRDSTRVDRRLRMEKGTRGKGDPVPPQG